MPAYQVELREVTSEANRYRKVRGRESSAFPGLAVYYDAEINRWNLLHILMKQRVSDKGFATEDIATRVGGEINIVNWKSEPCIHEFDTLRKEVIPLIKEAEKESR